MRREVSWKDPILVWDRQRPERWAAPYGPL